ncbi:MAG: hypothetical protein M2R45_02591 [Verrucomicrobia subdivision 3 bacterium]|nr:hypothetical protein [Limisphaerales bacterium]MCS1416439.1 hypothetical protein [Limisphaerales bacterium]
MSVSFRNSRHHQVGWSCFALSIWLGLEETPLQSELLALEGDIASELVAGVDRFLLNAFLLRRLRP